MPHAIEDEQASSPTIYNRTFWLAFLANLLLVAANALTYRFAEFIRFLGSTEEVTGQIIGAGLIGSLIWRLFLGQAMDRFGVRIVWLGSTLLYLAGGTLMTCSDDVGPMLWIARILFAIGLASMLTAALAHVQSLAPPHRRTEMIASYGASGFLGLIVGAQLGDLLFYLQPDGNSLYPLLFATTTVLGVGHGILGAILTRKDTHKKPHSTPGVHKLFLRYWPHRILTVTLMMGLVLTVTTIFLTRYATEQGIGGLRMFFSTYAITAFLMRLFTRHWNVVGRHRLIIIGLACHTVGIFLLLWVTQEWHFLIPAVCFGIGHALLFPCMVSLGTGAFPEQYRGTATTLCLASIDLGTMVTAPAVGWAIDHYGFHFMLTISCAVIAIATLQYALMNWSIIDEESRSPVLVPEKTESEIEHLNVLSNSKAGRPTRRDLQRHPAITKVG